MEGVTKTTQFQQVYDQQKNQHHEMTEGKRYVKMYIGGEGAQ